MLYSVDLLLIKLCLLNTNSVSLTTIRISYLRYLIASLIPLQTLILSLDSQFMCALFIARLLLKYVKLLPRIYAWYLFTAHGAHSDRHNKKLGTRTKTNT